MMIDLKETERLKEAIQNNPQDYKSIIESTNLAICITDNNGCYFDINQNYCNLYGYNKEELIGESFLIVVPHKTKEELNQLHETFMEVQIEIFRNWEVVNRAGELLKISVDAGYTDKINGLPQKLTFVHKL